MSRWIGASALGGALALHALPLAALLAIGTPPAAALEEAAITVFVEPGGAPATASDVAPSSQAAAAETATTREAPVERQLDDALPPLEPMDAQAVPDFRPPVSPAPELRDAVPLPDVSEVEAPDYKKQMPELRDAVPPPEPREAAVPDFRPPPAPPRQEPRKPTPPPQPQQRVEPRPAAPAPRAANPAPSPAPSTAPSPHSGFASAAPPAAASPQPGGAPAVAPGWNALLAAWLAANRRYPEEARRRGVEGEVTVRFSVAADGRVTEVAIAAGSGSSALDGAAVAMLRGARLPPPGTDVTRTVRIRYRLAD